VTRRASPEDDLESAITDYLALVLPDEVVTFHVPNEGKRSFGQQRKMKRLGMVAGVPDRCFIHNGGVSFIEVKAPKKYCTPVQKDMQERLFNAGANIDVCRSVEEVEHALIGFGIPLKQRVFA